jgi:hypothetical protein
MTAETISSARENRLSGLLAATADTSTGSERNK